MTPLVARGSLDCRSKLLLGKHWRSECCITRDLKRLSPSRHVCRRPTGWFYLFIFSKELCFVYKYKIWTICCVFSVQRKSRIPAGFGLMPWMWERYFCTFLLLAETWEKKCLLVQLHNPFSPWCFCPAAPLTASSAEESFTVNSREGGGIGGGGGSLTTIWLQKRTHAAPPPHSSSLLDKFQDLRPTWTPNSSSQPRTLRGHVTGARGWKCVLAFDAWRRRAAGVCVGNRRLRLPRRH